MLALQVSVLAAVILLAAGLVIGRPGLFPRPVLRVVLPMAPLLLIGVLCALMQSAYGAPLREWAIPAFAILAVGLFCRSDRAFRYATHGFLIAAVVLCWNFGEVISSGYTADPSMTRSLERSIQAGEIATAGRDLRKLTGVFPEGPVAAILHKPKYDAVKGTTFERQWHTPLTGLYRMHRKKGALWYPGGDVVVGSRQIEWRPIPPVESRPH